jgi:hypothetical protein
MNSTSNTKPLCYDMLLALACLLLLTSQLLSSFLFFIYLPIGGSFLSKEHPTCNVIPDVKWIVFVVCWRLLGDKAWCASAVLFVITLVVCAAPILDIQKTSSHLKSGSAGKKLLDNCSWKSSKYGGSNQPMLDITNNVLENRAIFGSGDKNIIWYGCWCKAVVRINLHFESSLGGETTYLYFSTCMGQHKGQQVLQLHFGQCSFFAMIEEPCIDENIVTVIKIT